MSMRVYGLSDTPVVYNSPQVRYENTALNNRVTRAGLTAVGFSSLYTALAFESPALGTVGALSLGLCQRMQSLAVIYKPQIISYTHCRATRLFEDMDYADLEELLLYHSRITRLPNGFNPPKLKVINASFCPLQDFPLGFNPPKLETIDLSDTINLIRIPEEFHPRNLLSFHAPNSNLELLPDQWNLPKVILINLNHSNIRYFPEGVNFPNLEILDLGNSPIIRLPSASFMPKLKHLNLSSTNLNVLPEYLDFPELVRLDLRNTPLSSLPESIFSLRFDCTVHLSLMNFPQDFQEHLHERIASPGYTGPRFEFSTQQDQGIQRSGSPIIGMQNLLNETQDLSDPVLLVNQLAVDANSPQIFLRDLHIWLDKLFLPASANSEAKHAFFENVIQNLKDVSEDPELRSFFQDLVGGTTSTCGDGIVLSSIHLDNQIRALKMDASNSLEVFLFLVGTIYAMDVLHQTAKNIILDLNSRDPVEVYLALPIKLKDEFEIDINIDEMLFFNYSGLTDIHLEQAKSILRDAQNDEEKVILFLIDQPKWREVLSSAFSDEYAQAIQERDDRAADIETSDLALKSFHEKLIELSQRLITSF